jgi:hypothetical protein
MTLSTESTRPSEPEQPRQRKPYQPPKLEVYGNIREITKHVGNNSPNFDPPPWAGFRFTTR